jgi:hypothetical protein
MDHHEIFRQFKPFAGVVPTDFKVDFIGAITHKKFIHNFVRKSSVVVKDYPPFNEEYFEWIDILEAVALATGSFTMLELGAGYGRWSARGVVAARQKGIENISITVVNGDPFHYLWAQEHLINNGLRKDQFFSYNYVIGGKKEKVFFCVKKPVGSVQNSPREWYGQAKIGRDLKTSFWKKIQQQITGQKNYKTYAGKKLIAYPDGWDGIEAQQMTIDYFTAKYEMIDIMDLDVQGEEFNAINSSIGEINKKVKRLHIGTHSKEIENSLFELLTKHGWKCLNNYHSLKINDTPFGPIRFVDGLQSWINPRLN